MMDSLQDLMAGSSIDEPPQIKAIKSYVQKVYDSPCSVSITPRDYIVTVPSAPLANTIQLEKAALVAACELEKPLRIRIGG